MALRAAGTAKSPTVPYRTLLRSVVTIAARTRGVGSIMLLGALTMFVFTLFWTSLTFLLSAAPFATDPSQSACSGSPGSSVPQRPKEAEGCTTKAMTSPGRSSPGYSCSWLSGSVPLAAIRSWLLAGTVLFDLAIQTQRIFNQSQAFALAPNSRSRVNTAYIAGNFTGAACGSLLATALWAVDRWPAVTSTGAGTAVVALAICAVGALRRGRPAH